MKNIYIILFIFSSRSLSQEIQSKEQKEVYGTIVLIGKAWTENNMDTLEKYIDAQYIRTDVRVRF